LLSQTTCFNFSFSDFTLQGHILTTTGVALTKRDPPPIGSSHKKPKLPSQLMGKERKRQVFLA
jgi:hypothetical protein